VRELNSKDWLPDENSSRGRDGFGVVRSEKGDPDRYKVLKSEVQHSTLRASRSYAEMRRNMI